MKKTFIIVSIILSLIILGCAIPLETSRDIKQDTRSTPEQSSSGGDDEEKERLKEKIADLEKEKLEEKIEELEKKVEDQKKQPSSKTTTRTRTTTKRPPKGYVRVNSPGDGWLALRTEPSTQTGRRILKIPHGTLLTLGACTGVRTSGRLRARWCETSYRGYEGWVFDYYLIR